ncbi:ATP-binding SpoIIE family protein phosphatase [Streptomyces griseus]|uniref:ATP-binding SpoIIE family protein phosphatase n=1 Tax=Streptomyces griseus TaxID=1911 RepID=UPI00056AE43D|nr:ATP-binding SpoIIE family protein phosphatase [Streptomyces griseus]
MRAIPTQRETDSVASEVPAHSRAQARTALSGSSLAPGSARALLRAALEEWTDLGLPGTEHVTGRLAEDAMLVVSELVTNAVVHAGTDVELVCGLEETGAVVVEVSDHHPSRPPRDGTPETPYETPEYGRGLRLVSALSETWGVTFRRGAKTVWARIPAREEGYGAEVGGVGEGYGAHAGEGYGAHAREGYGAHAREGYGAGASRLSGAHAGAMELYSAAHIPLYAWSGADPHTPEAPETPAVPAIPEGPAAPAFPAVQEAYEDRRAGGERDWLNRGALSFLAEASDLLAGQLDEDLVASLTAQLVVPRLADWCAVWLEDELSGRGGWTADGTAGAGARLARVWHGSENRIEELRRALEKDPPRPPDTLRSGPVPFPWPGAALGAAGADGAALAYRLVAGSRPLGTLVIGRAAIPRFPDEVTGLVEDLGRRVALAIGAARQYARQATISAVLQRGLLPGAVAEIPGVRSALVYEPCDKGGPSGDFYDLFPAGDGRWCFAVGDVQGKGPEAAVVIGLARPWLRLLAREGYGVADVLDRLNQLLLDDATEAADAAARALVGPAVPGDGPQTRFLSLLYGELAPFEGGVRCTLASAGHPLPLLLGPDGSVRTAAQPQTLLGVIEEATYTCDSVELRPGDSLLCVTDGVTERRCGSRQFDDGDGLATVLAGCAGLDADLIAERIKRLVHEFGGQPPEDDLALLVLQAE